MEKFCIVHFTFVVLHYITYNDTVECVESLLDNLTFKDYNIVIVDNGSPNDSGEVLRKKYQGHEKVSVVLLENNLGFANGNNIGFKIAKYVFRTKFIIFINSDTLVLQKDFLEKIDEIYDRTQFYVLGPDIVSMVDGNHQNPARQNGFSKKELILWIFHLSFLLLANYLQVDNILRRLKRVVLTSRTIRNISHDFEQINVQLHGSCLIFSPKYIAKFEGLCPKTFMYMEEDILYHQMESLGLLSLYSPEIIILHKEDGATDAVFPSEVKKNRYKYKNLISSSIILFKMKFKKIAEH